MIPSRIHYLLLISFFFIHHAFSAAPQPPRFQTMAIDGINRFNRSLANDFAARERSTNRRNAALNQAAADLAAGRITQTQFDVQRGIIENEQQRADVLGNFDLQVAQTGLNIIGQVAETTQKIAVANADRSTRIAEAAVRAREDRQGQLDRIQHLTSPDVLKRTGTILVGVGALLTLSYFSFRLIYNYAMTKMGVPSLVRETSTVSIKDQVYNSFMGKEKVHPLTFSDLVVNPKLDDQVKAISYDARSNYKVGLPHKNLLLYGPPGTGKTTIAKLLARYTGMDYAIMSGADFAQFPDGKDVEELHKLFDWAEKSPKGLIIFIDEIDAFARDRSKASQRAVNLLNAFLSRTGELSSKFMVVGATNYKTELDSAFMSRMHKQLEVPVPGFEERVQLLTTYLKKYISNDKRTLKNDDGEERSIALSINNNEITQDFIGKVANITEGFTGRDIAFMIDEVRAECYRLEEYILNRATFMRVLEQKLDQFSTSSGRAINIPAELYIVEEKPVEDINELSYDDLDQAIDNHKNKNLNLEEYNTEII